MTTNEKGQPVFVPGQIEGPGAFFPPLHGQGADAEPAVSLAVEVYLFSMQATTGNYIHGYMVNAGFAENVMAWHQRCPETELRFFWDRKGEKEVKVIDETLSFHPLDDKAFLKQMSGCKAYASTAGYS